MAEIGDRRLVDAERGAGAQQHDDVLRLRLARGDQLVDPPREHARLRAAPQRRRRELGAEALLVGLPAVEVDHQEL